MLKSGGIFVGFVRPMYAFGRPRELRSRGLITLYKKEVLVLCKNVFCIHSVGGSESQNICIFKE